MSTRALANLFGVILTLSLTTPSSAQAPAGEDALPVLALRELTLKPGVAAQEFERHFAEVEAPRLMTRIPGLQVYLIRGERGDRVGTYQLVYEFDSLARRNAYFPRPDGTSELLDRLIQGMPASELSRFVDTDGKYTDYVVLRR